jgi:hypothetical protein
MKMLPAPPVFPHYVLRARLFGVKAATVFGVFSITEMGAM